jgi:hypothetical protein
LHQDNAEIAVQSPAQALQSNGSYSVYSLIHATKSASVVGAAECGLKDNALGFGWGTVEG